MTHPWLCKGSAEPEVPAHAACPCSSMLCSSPWDQSQRLLVATTGSPLRRAPLAIRSQPGVEPGPHGGAHGRAHGAQHPCRCGGSAGWLGASGQSPLPSCAGRTRATARPLGVRCTTHNPASSCRECQLMLPGGPAGRRCQVGCEGGLGYLVAVQGPGS